MNKEKFLVDFKNKNTPVEIIGDIVDWKVDVKCKCLLCNEEFYMRPINLKRGSIHSKCSYKIRGKNKKSSTNEFKDKLYNVNKDIEVIGEYEKAIIPIEVKCKICGHIWKSTPNNLLRNHGCPICYHIKQSETMKGNTIGKIKTNYEIPIICKNLKSKFPNLIFLQEIKNLSSIILCKCKKCDNTWETNINNLCNLNSKECCPYCSDRLLNIERIDDFLLNHKIMRTNTPLKWSDKVNCVCKVCNYKWDVKAGILFKRKGCPKCLHKVKRTHEEFLQEVSIDNPNVELLSEYINSKTKIKRKCKLCGDISEMLPNDILENVCKGCASIKAHNKLAKSHEDFCSDFAEKYGDTYLVLDNYINSNTKITIKHIECNNTFTYLPSNIYNRNIHICPYCYNKVSNGERVIENIFNKRKISYHQHKTFPALRGINNGFLSYDFYLKEHNILIEFQGIQHYEPISAFGVEEQFKIQQEHDKRKREYAINNNIKLLEIPYWDFDNIEEILSRELGLTA